MAALPCSFAHGLTVAVSPAFGGTGLMYGLPHALSWSQSHLEGQLFEPRVISWSFSRQIEFSNSADLGLQHSQEISKAGRSETQQLAAAGSGLYEVV